MKESTLIFKALANPSRLAIVELLLKEEMVVGELLEALGISGTLMSHNLNQLTKWGIIKYEYEGNFKRFSITPKAFDEENDQWVLLPPILKKLISTSDRIINTLSGVRK